MKAMIFLLAALTMLGLSPLAMAQDSRSADITFDVLVAQQPLVIDSPNDLALDDGGTGVLAPGVAVAAVPDGADAWLTAGLAGTGTTGYQENLAGNPASFDVLGAAGANVVVSFALPFVLYPSANGNGVVHVDYNGTSACWVDANGTPNYFNPKQGENVTLNADGATPTHFNLGGIFTVDRTATSDDYIGVAIVTVAYAAN